MFNSSRRQADDSFFSSYYYRGRGVRHALFPHLVPTWWSKCHSVKAIITSHVSAFIFNYNMSFCRSNRSMRNPLRKECGLCNMILDQRSWDGEDYNSVLFCKELCKNGAFGQRRTRKRCKLFDVTTWKTFLTSHKTYYELNIFVSNL